MSSAGAFESALSGRGRPKRSTFCDFFQGRHQPSHIFPHVRNVIRVQTSGKEAAGKELDHIRQRDDAIICSMLKTAPVANMFFRPEEIHGASGVREVGEPILEGNGGISDQSLRSRAPYLTILHFKQDRRTTIETWCIDPDNFAGKKPADRQRFETSLCKPLLLTVDCDAVLCGKVVKGWKRGNVIGLGKEPPRKSRGKKLMQALSPLFDRNAQFGPEFRVVGRLTCLNHAFHDDLEGLV